MAAWFPATDGQWILAGPVNQPAETERLCNSVLFTTNSFPPPTWLFPMAFEVKPIVVCGAKWQIVINQSCAIQFNQGYIAFISWSACWKVCQGLPMCLTLCQENNQSRRQRLILKELSWVWWHTLGIPTLRRLRQEDQKPGLHSEFQFQTGLHRQILSLKLIN
jgi:hypothetical protein